jgi:branched-chain amino acid transport system substrate-binding protein
MSGDGLTNGSAQRTFRAIAGAVGCAVALALTACGSGTDRTSGPATDRPLTIGISLSQTGDFAGPGKAAERGYELWADVVNRRGGILGRRVELRIVDDGSAPDQVAANYQTLITRDRVDLVFGPFSSLLTIPASQVAARHRYAFLEPAGGGPKVFEQHLSNLFFVQPAPVVKQGEVFADFILSLPPAERPKTAAYPALDDPFAAPIADHVRGTFEAAGIRTVYTKVYPAGTTDFRRIAAAVAAARPDVVVAGTQVEDGYGLTRAMIRLKFAPSRLFVSNGANSPVDFPREVGQANTNGIFSSSDWFAESPAPASTEFTRAYAARFGGSAQDIDATSAEAYSCGMLVEQVAKKTGKIDNATLITTLHSGVWPTLVGDLSWDAYGAPRGSFLLVQWIDGRLMPVFPMEQAHHAPSAGPLPWAG